MLAVDYEQVTQVDDTLTIQIQFPNGRTACRRQTNEIKMVRTPGEMHGPVVLSWMKERHPSPRRRIEGARFAGFGTITTLTSQSEVVFGALAALTFRYDMFDGMQLRGAEFRADAIFAITQCALPDQSSQFGWNALFSHAGQV